MITAENKVWGWTLVYRMLSGTSGRYSHVVKGFIWLGDTWPEWRSLKDYKAAAPDLSPLLPSFLSLPLYSTLLSCGLFCCCPPSCLSTFHSPGYLSILSQRSVSVLVCVRVCPYVCVCWRRWPTGLASGHFIKVCFNLLLCSCELLHPGTRMHAHRHMHMHTWSSPSWDMAY